jgi:hypothetical protein
VENLVVRAVASVGKIYAARDVVNAPDIKASIARRSAARKDPEEITAWLVNHFYRQMVSNFKAQTPYLVEIKTTEDARAQFKNLPVPGWVINRLRSPDVDNATMWWIDCNAPELLSLEAKVVEFLSSRRGTSLEGKLMRVNCPQALALWAAEHAAFETKAAAGWIDHTPSAVSVAWRGVHGTFVEFISTSDGLRTEMAYESQMMRHCLGQFANRKSKTGGYGERYASECEKGQIRLFSYRSVEHAPKITISAFVKEDGTLEIDQIKGKQNRPPIERYRIEVRDFLNTLNTNLVAPPDANAMGLVRVNSGWCTLAEVTQEADQLLIVNRSPGLISELPATSPVVQWLVAAKMDSALLGVKVSDGVRAALAVSQNVKAKSG